jgi:D-glycero-alpha-D-manno-heptose-7-phosphate kinase
VPSCVAGGWDRHPLLEAAIEQLPPPGHVAIEVIVTCGAPAGAATGTSAAVAVALVGALDRLRDGTLTQAQAAQAAHAIETDRLGQQSGIQDQICAAMGGINDIEMHAYPDAAVRRVGIDEATRAALERRLALVFLGRRHHSSAMHERVIERLAGLGPDCDELEDLRRAADAACRALAVGDLVAFGRAMQDNTHAQRRLHPDLVSPLADRVIAIARDGAAAGWKVNGAGGSGGSLTLLGPSAPNAMRAMLDAIASGCPGVRHIPTTLDRDGLRVWTA